MVGVRQRPDAASTPLGCKTLTFTSPAIRRSSWPPRFTTIAPARAPGQISRIAPGHPAFARGGGARYGLHEAVRINGDPQTMSDEQARDYGFETLAIHAGAAPDPTTGARATPIYQTTSFVFDDVDHAASLFNLQRFGNIYSRITNPTVSVLEERVAALEGGTAACAVASGHAAQFVAFLNLMTPGDEIISSTKLYGGSITQFSETFPRFDWHVRFVDPTRPKQFRKALRKRTKAIFIESASNPDGVVADLEAIAEIAHAAGVPLVVDNTMPTPYLCQPISTAPMSSSTR